MLVLSVLLSLGIAEALLRVRGIRPDAGRLDVYQFDETLGWVTRRKAAFYRSSPRFAHWTYYDAEGLPVSRADLEKPADFGAPSILIVGDSFVESYYVPYDESFPYLVSRSMSDRKVVNLGVSGYSPEQYLLRLRAEAPKYDVTDVVVVFFAFNDVPAIDAPLYQGYAKPVFGQTFDRPVNTPLRRMSPRDRDGLAARALRRSAIHQVLQPLLVQWTGGPEITPLKHEILVLDEERFAKAMKMFAAGRLAVPGARYRVVYMPCWQEAVDEAALEHNIQLFRRHCAAEQLSCAVAPFAGMSREALESQYLIGDGHLSRAGSATMARFLSGLLRANDERAGAAER